MLTERRKEKYKRLCKNGKNELNHHLIKACKDGHLEDVKYLLTDWNLKEYAEYANTCMWNDSGFRFACFGGNLEIVKYLLTSSDLKEHADVHSDDDNGFRYACNSGKMEVIKYLIFDYNIEKTKEISDFLEKNKDEPFSGEVEEMFLARDFKKDLLNSLNVGENKSKMKL